jgi:dynein heavy chain 1
MDETLQQIEEVTNEYAPLSTMTTRIFFSLESMSSVHYLYQYSLQQFMDCVFHVLKHNEELKAVPKSQPQDRLKVIMKQLYIYVNQTIGQGLLQEHQMLFTLRLAQIKLTEDNTCDQLFEIFLKASSVMEPQILPLRLLDGRVTKTQVGALEELTFTPHFKGLTEHIQDCEKEWIDMFDNALAESVVPEPWMQDGDSSVSNPVARNLKKLIMIKILRPDRLMSAVN